ncbi:amino acid permease [Algoriphagus sp.]|uniref:APC family permease n=1 Tax=Algoriphagus sp. TaxID=1872435 RepID=UPI002626380C|nr:amino acid permease [Algoriphagus sp.]
MSFSSDSSFPKLQKIGWKTAAGLVIANIIGTGVFTSLGFQLVEIQNTWSILLLWSIGGGMALMGALIYAELGTHFRKTGGDYIFLSQTIHPVVGYLYAWVSLTVGFSAPIAIAGMAMNNYLSPLTGKTILPGLLVLLILPIAHSISLAKSAIFQNFLTLFKILFLLCLIGIGFWFSTNSNTTALNFDSTWSLEILQPGFAVSLIYVFFSYTGWNSAAYIVEEVKEPQKSLPKALIIATLFVTLVYLLFHFVLLKHASLEQLVGKIEVTEIAFSNILGNDAGLWVGLFIGIQLLATISGYAWIGPRITFAMAKDFKIWRPLSQTNSQGIPVRAILLNTLISLILFLSGSFEQIMLYAGFVLQLMGTITIFASLKIQNPEGFITPWKPIPQILYLISSLVISGYLIYERPLESLAGLGLLAIGFLLFLVDKKKTA